MARRRKPPSSDAPPPSPIPGAPPSPADLRLARLRGWRTKPERDLRLGAFLPAWVERNITQPQKGLGKVMQLWLELAPPEVIEHTRLESLRGGVLRVGVDSSAWRYEIDRLLREGLRERLIKRLTGATLLRIDMRVVDARDWTKPVRATKAGEGQTKVDRRSAVVDEVLGGAEEV